MAAVEQQGEALIYASGEMKDNPFIVQAAVRRNGYALKYASDAMKGNKAIRQAAVYPRHTNWDLKAKMKRCSADFRSSA